MSEEAVRFERDGAVATIILNRPEKLNAIDETLRAGLIAAIETVERDHRLRVAVITGAGRGFCSGGDIEIMDALKSGHHSVTFRSYLEAGHDVVRAMRRLMKPVLASVNGPAAGAGMNLALACDLRIASDRATFTQAFLRLGLHPDWGGTYLLPRLVGTSRALEMFWLNDPISAERAERMGLVNFVVPHESLEAETRRLAERLAEAPPLPVALLEQAFYERLETDLDRVMQSELDAQMKCFNSQDFDEGRRAFAEKRAAKFTGV